jgi:predicted NAD-dependent protein-ADP-ribosyltransferase YbiA (DUF1768 family)
VKLAKSNSKVDMTGPPILFYKKDKPYGYMSNFYASPITLDGKKWPTTEHYF